MVQLRTKLHVADNSGVKLVRTIQVMGVKRRAGHLGRLVVASVLKSSPTSTMTKGTLVRGYLVNTVYGASRPTGVVQRFDRNAILLVTKKLEPLATRVRVPLPKDLRRLGRSKRRSLGATVV